MSGICGWLNGSLEGSAIEDLLRTMSRRLGDADGGETPTEAWAGSGVAALAAPRTAGVARVDDRLVAYEGHPTFTLPGFEGLTPGSALAAALGEAHRAHGDSMLDHLHGPFALAVVEPAKQRAFLAIDRLGVRPLAVATSRGGLVFGSRLDAVLAHPGVTAELDPQALFSYLYFHQVPSPGCVYRGLRKLRPGESVTYRGGRLEQRLYWMPGYDDTEARPELALAEELRAELAAAVRRCLDDRPSGAFLSGGLDSSTVTGFLAPLRPDPVDAYAIGFDAAGYDEMHYARASARHARARLHEHYLSAEEVAAAIPRIASAYDEPFGNASAVPTYYCARMARRDGKDLLLAGDGGDEIFAGNARYVRQAVLDLYHRVPAWLRQRVVDPLALGFPAAQGFAPGRKLRSYVQQAATPMPARLESYNFLHREPLTEVLHPDFLGAIDPGAPLQSLTEVYERPEKTSMLKQMLYLDLKVTLADNDLRKVGRMCELAGLDVRFPMLDEQLVELAARVPSRLLLRRWQIRAFYRRALRGVLARETLAKQKHGFGLPFGVWMAEHRGLRELAGDSLGALRRRHYVDPGYIDRLLDSHREQHAAYYGVFVWVLMMLEQWLETHGH